MMKQWFTPLAVIAGTAVMFACASAQEAPASAPAKAAQKTDKAVQKKAAAKKSVTKATDEKKADGDEAKKDEEQKGDAKADAKTDSKDSGDDSEAPILYNSLTLGYTSWSSNNNINQINQNGYVTGGFGISGLSILQPFEHDRFLALDYLGTPGNDYGMRLVNEWGSNTSLNFHSHQFSFLDPGLGVRFPSVDSGWDVTVDHQIAPNFGAFASYKYTEGQHHFPAPYDQPNYNNGTLTLGTQKQFGANVIGASFVENRFNDATGVQAPTLTDRGEIRYSGSWGSRLTAQGTAAATRIQVVGQPDNWVHDYSVSGIYDVDENSTLGGSLSQSVMDFHSIQNAYVRKRNLSGINFETHLDKWGLGLGYQRREEERMRADQSFVDVPKWNIFDVKLNGRLNSQLRLGLKGSMEDMVTTPVFLTNDPTLLYWNRKATFNAKVSGGSDVTNGYFSYTCRYRRNDERGYSITWNNFAFGGSRIFSPKLLGYAEFSSDLYAVGGTSPAATALGAYFPTSETFLIGVDFTRNERENLSFVISSFYTQDQWGQQIACTYNRDLGKERNIQITLSPWLQRDRLYNVDTFDAAIVAVKVGVRF